MNKGSAVGSRDEIASGSGERNASSITPVSALSPNADSRIKTESEKTVTINYEFFANLLNQNGNINNIIVCIKCGPQNIY